MCDEYNNPVFDESSDKYNNEISQKDVKKVNYASFTLKYVDAPLDTDIKIINGEYQNKTK